MRQLIISPADEAMDEFRRQAGLISLRCRVSDDGEMMVYVLSKDRKYNAEILTRARRVISERNLPLSAYLHESILHDVLLRVTLVIEYNEPPKPL